MPSCTQPTSLRIALENMILDGTPVSTYPEKLVVMSQATPHTVVIQPPPANVKLRDFNCVMHALGLIDQIEEPRNLEGFIADTGFVKYLLDRAVLIPGDAVVGNLVVWSSEGLVQHIGVVVADGRAISKWGIGHLCEHGFLEGPVSWGNDVTYFLPLSAEFAFNQFKEFFIASRS